MHISKCLKSHDELSHFSASRIRYYQLIGLDRVMRKTDKMISQLFDARLSIIWKRFGADAASRKIIYLVFDNLILLSECWSKVLEISVNLDVDWLLNSLIAGSILTGSVISVSTGSVSTGSVLAGSVSSVYVLAGSVQCWSNWNTGD